MIKLSRQAWNNVLIVTMIVMIFLFNSTNNFLNSGADDGPEEMPLLPEGSLILTVEFGAQKVERIGRTWRTNPPTEVSSETLAEVINNWQAARVIEDAGEAPHDPIVVVVWLAGESKGYVYQLAQEGNESFVYYDSRRYRMLNSSVQALMLKRMTDA